MPQHAGYFLTFALLVKHVFFGISYDSCSFVSFRILIEGLKEENSYPYIVQSAEEDNKVFV